MSGIEKAKKVLDAVGTGLHALDAIGKLARGTLADKTGFSDDRLERLEGVVFTIIGVVDAARGALDGSVSIEELEKEIKKVSSDLAMNDGNVAGQIDAKFPK